eukprot:7671584-Lingulodinium_polyedra.AAC.1
MPAVMSSRCPFVLVPGPARPRGGRASARGAAGPRGRPAQPAASAPRSRCPARKAGRSPTPPSCRSRLMTAP